MVTANGRRFADFAVRPAGRVDFRDLSGIARYVLLMGFSDRRAVKHVKEPVNGIFSVTGFYDARSHTVLTVVITAPGI